MELWAYRIAILLLIGLFILAFRKDLPSFLKDNLNWIVGLGLLAVFTIAGLAVNNNAAEPNAALGEWTDWFTNVVALVVAVFGVVDAVPKIATSVEERAKARRSQRQAEALLASKAAIDAGVDPKVVEKYLG